jgi:hypothetical protein
MPDGRKRLLILGGVGALLAVVLAFQQLWPRGDEPRPQTPRVTPTKTQGAIEPPPAAVAASGFQAPETSYDRLLAVSQQPSPQDVPVLKKAIQSPAWEDRHAGVMGLGRLKEKGDPATLLAVLTNAEEKAEVRAEAAEQLGAMKCMDAGPALIDAMSDDSELVRTAAGVGASKLMGMRFDFSARDPVNKREEAVRLAKMHWKILTDELQRMRN